MRRPLPPPTSRPVGAETARPCVFGRRRRADTVRGRKPDSGPAVTPAVTQEQKRHVDFSAKLLILLIKEKR
jgi:hypothetical protein